MSKSKNKKPPTPQEQAIALHKEMAMCMNGPGIDASRDNAKRCALVAVEHIIQACKIQQNWPDEMMKHTVFYTYWEIVRQELNKI